MSLQITDPNYPGFALPTVINPPDHLCFTVKVPNDQGHIAAFLGSLFELTQWISWQRDSAKRGKDAAAVWRDIWYDLEAQSCNLPPVALHGAEIEEFMPLRVDCDCNVFITCCDGTEKQILTAAQVNALLVNQPAAGAPQPAAGACTTYYGNIPGNTTFLVPTPVNTGDTIKILDAVGATNDAQDARWRCPDGELFFAGACEPFYESAAPLDPLATAHHLQLIVEIAGTFYALTVGTAFTVPALITNQQPTIQVNGQQSTASGSVQFHVEVCNNAVATWTRTFNFEAGLQGWTIEPTWGTWTPGSGLQGNTPGATRELRAYRSVSSFPAFTHFSMAITCDDIIGTEMPELNRYPTCPPGGGGSSAYNSAAADHASIIYTTPQTGVLSFAAGSGCIELNPTGYPTSTVLTVHSVTFSGVGSDPFGP